MVKSLFNSVIKLPKTLVLVGWISFIVGQLMQAHIWLKVAFLMIARGLPQSFPASTCCFYNFRVRDLATVQSRPVRPSCSCNR